MLFNTPLVIFVCSHLHTAKSQEIVCLEEKVSQLREGEQKKESDFAKKMQEKEQEIKNAKKDILTTRVNCLEKEFEIKELTEELNSMKGNLRIGSAGFNYDTRHAFSL